MSSPTIGIFNAVVRKSILTTVPKQPLINSVRFRKPRWLPIAKSKEFYVRKPTPIIPEEAEELYMRYSKYRADIASIRLFLQEQLSQKKISPTEQQEKDDAADLIQMAEQVKNWNSRVATAREERQEEQEELERKHIEEVSQKLQENRLKRALQAEKKLERNKAENFIHPDDLDAAIEVMLDSRSDYNYAISKAGEIIPGEYPDHPSNPTPPRTKMSDIP